MKQQKRFKVYFYDDFGAERCAGTYYAKSKGHAELQVRKEGIKGPLEIEEIL